MDLKSATLIGIKRAGSLMSPDTCCARHFTLNKSASKFETREKGIPELSNNKDFWESLKSYKRNQMASPDPRARVFKPQSCPRCASFKRIPQSTPEALVAGQRTSERDLKYFHGPIYSTKYKGCLSKKSLLDTAADYDDYVISDQERGLPMDKVKEKMRILATILKRKSLRKSIS